VQGQHWKATLISLLSKDYLLKDEKGLSMGEMLMVNFHQPTVVESEAFVQAFSPGSTFELRLKAFRRRGPKCPLETPTLYSRFVLRTMTKGGVSQRHFPAMIDAGF
jgi:hypothetical protein